METNIDHTQAAEAAEQEARDSFERCDTDGFVSQAASGITAREHRLAAEIEANGGTSTFPALFNLEGERVRAKLIPGKYGDCWAFCDADDRFTGVFVSAFPARPATMAKKGYVEGKEVAGAYATTSAPEGARGFIGLSSVRVVARRTDKGYPADAK